MTNEDRSQLLDFLADDLTADELEVLVRRLKAEPALADQVLLLAGDEARLVQWARTAAGSNKPSDILTADGEKSADGSGSSLAPVSDSTGAAKPTGRRVGRLLLFASSFAAAAALLIAFGLRGGSEKSGAQPAGSEIAVTGDREAVAQIINETGDADWFIENRTRNDPSRLCRGDTVRLNAGSLRVLYDHGTSLTLQAPAVLEIEGPMLARIQSGSIRVLVAKGAEGFSIATPIAKVVDLGTEFGVRVDHRGGTDVVVYQGSVDVEGRSNENGSPQLAKRLTTGEAMRLDERGTASRLVTVESRNFPRGGGGNLERSANLRPPVIKEVFDNINRNDSFHFYEIVQAGMREDALAFVDRPDHQWNGIDRAGMPKYLIGGDYVRTFNDDKLSGVLEITLRTTCPATIYILLDNRVESPEWLVKEFERTNDKIGLDRGIGRLRDPGPDGAPQWTRRPTGIGAGVSIDDSFTIWKRTIPKAGDVVLGPLRGHDWDTNMYGIVAVPLHR